MSRVDNTTTKTIERKKDTCAICIQYFKSEEPEIVLSCSHGYHIECLKYWTCKFPEPNCPTCRCPLVDIDRIRLPPDAHYDRVKMQEAEEMEVESVPSIVFRLHGQMRNLERMQRDQDDTRDMHFVVIDRISNSLPELRDRLQSERLRSEGVMAWLDRCLSLEQDIEKQLGILSDIISFFERYWTKRSAIVASHQRIAREAVSLPFATEVSTLHMGWSQTFIDEEAFQLEITNNRLSEAMRLYDELCALYY